MKNPYKLRGVEEEYARKLRQVADQVGMFINGFTPGDMSSVPKITDILQRYSETLTQWAASAAGKMLADVERRDRALWLQISKEMSVGLRKEIRSAPTGNALRELLSDQVSLIKSIPTEAAKRVHELTLVGIENGSRSKEIAAEIMRSGEVARSRATLIARTGVSSTATNLTQARALHIGSEGYFWRTVGDSDVRESHRKMNGKFVRWDEPPTLTETSGTGKSFSMTGHAGCVPNCRCYAEPIIPE
ncbi:phage minor head protein [Chromobacterium haemolyticum]|uniref:phage head morphogenesis protein n=1 Tax=Chromobacterium haemolyticum TaxID=394935 RepID=UPI00059371D6|nr:phage minor head protein [Chromobacterium haemolyticum]